MGCGGQGADAFLAPYATSTPLTTLKNSFKSAVFTLYHPPTWLPGSTTAQPIILKDFGSQQAFPYDAHHNAWWFHYLRSRFPNPILSSYIFYIDTGSFSYPTPSSYFPWSYVGLGHYQNLMPSIISVWNTQLHLYCHLSFKSHHLTHQQQESFKQLSVPLIYESYHLHCPSHPWQPATPSLLHPRTSQFIQRKSQP